jgi:dephospho-CoA kinase
VNSKPFTGLPVIGLIGGIGSGKSAVARGLMARQPFVLIDADAIGHQVLKQDFVKELIKKRFGGDVFDPRGEIDRSKLARNVFGPDESAQLARRDLNQIVHPVIGETIHKEIQLAQDRARREPGTIQGVLLDAAILLETGWGEMCDAIAFVDASPHIREQRVRETRGWEPADWKKREESQMNLETKRKASDVIINNSGELKVAVDELERFLRVSFSPGVRPNN